MNFYIEYNSECGYKWTSILRFDDTNWKIVG